MQKGFTNLFLNLLLFLSLYIDFAMVKLFIDDSEVVYNAKFEKIKFLTDDSLPLGKLIYFPTMTVIIRCVFKQNRVFYPQVYLDGCLYQI